MHCYRFRRAIAAWTCVSAPVAIALGCFLLVIGLFQQPWLGATIGVVLASAEFALSFRRVRRRTLTVTAEGLEVQRDKYRLLVPWPAIATVQHRRHQLVVAVEELVVKGADVVPLDYRGRSTSLDTTSLEGRPAASRVMVSLYDKQWRQGPIGERLRRDGVLPPA